MRAVPQVAVKFVSEHEACVLKAYPDPGSVDGNPITVGYGHTGPEVIRGLTITKAKALLYLKDDMENAAQKLAVRVKADVIEELTENQYAALLSFVFNVGAGRSWTIWGVLNKRAYSQVPAQLMRFVYNDGKKMNGLVNRRAAECVLWSTGEPDTVEETPPSSVTRSTPTPPARTDPVPMKSDVGVLGTAGAAVATTVTAAANQAPGFIKQGIDVIRPFAADSEMVQNVIANLSTVAAVAAIVGFLIVLWKKHNSRAMT
jgi:lysozyme